MPRWHRDIRDPRVAVLSLALAVATTGVARAQEQEHDEAHSHERESTHHAGLHFSHPMIAESVSPDTKIRVDHQFFDFPDGDEENSGVLEAEYAFHRSFSIEMGLPYTYTQTAFGNLDVAFKFANYAFEGAGLLLGYGVEVGFPTNGSPAEDHEHEEEGAAASGGTGDPPAGAFRAARSESSMGSVPPPALHTGGSGVAGTLGTSEYELAPFVNLGFQRGGWELVGWLLFEIPFNQEEPGEVATELGWNASILYEVSPRLQTLLEFDGSGGISGAAVGEDVLNIAPGMKFAPLADRPLFVGLSAGFPVADEEPFDTRLKASLFWHF